MLYYPPLILKKRKEKGITQAQFASAIHYSVQTVAKYESGASEMDSVSLIYASRFLGVDIDSFLYGIDAKNNDLADTHDFDPDLFAHNLATARIGRRIGQKKLSMVVSCSVRSIKNYEAGNSVPSLSILREICEALDVKAAELFFEDLSLRKEFMVPTKNKKLWIATAGSVGGAIFTGMFFLSGSLLTDYVNSRVEVEPAATVMEVQEEEAPKSKPSAITVHNGPVVVEVKLPAKPYDVSK